MKLDWKTCWKACLSVFLLYLCVHYFPAATDLLATVIGAASPVLIGCIVAYAVNLLMVFYEKLYFPRTNRPFLAKSRRPICMLAAYVTVAAILALVLLLVVPQLVSCVKLLLSDIPAAAEHLVAALDELEFIPDDYIARLEAIDWKTHLRSLLDNLGNVMNLLMNTVLSVFNGVVTAFLALIFSIYILASKERLKRQFDRLLYHALRPRLYGHVIYVLHILHDSFRSYLIGQCTEAVILGGLCTAGMLIFGFPYATMIGAFIAVTALIPVAGAYIGAIVGAFIIFMVSPIKALWFLIFILILQQIEGNLIYPKVVGSSLRLPALWVLAAVTVGGGLFGIAGMLLGVPLAAAGYRILRERIPPKPQSVSTPAPSQQNNDTPPAPPAI